MTIRADILDQASRLDIAVRWMAQILREEGLDWQTGLLSAGLQPDLLDRPVETITGRQEFIFQRHFIAITRRRRDLWLMLGLRHRLPAFGPAGLAMLTAPTLRHFIEFLCRSRSTYYSFIRYRTVIDDDGRDGITLTVAECPADLREFTLYRHIGACMTTMASVWPDAANLVRVDLALKPSPDLGIWERLGVMPGFGMSDNRITWPSEYSDVALPGADEQLHSHYAAKATIEPADTTSDSLLARALEQMSRADPARTLSELADSLALSRRSLQRKLAENGLSFRDLLDQVRMRRATDMLGQGDVPIVEIAHRVGFGSRGGFEHAFRRSLRMTPSQYRRRSTGAPG